MDASRDPRLVFALRVEHNTAFVFPGQGSQYAGMGRDVAAKYPAARKVFDGIDRALSFSISALCFDGPEDQLKLTENTQPAILAVSSAIHAVLEERGATRRDLVAGHSLGEYSAIVSDGGLTPAEGAKIVRARGKFMQEAVPVGSGAMAALIGASVEQAHEICGQAAEGDVVSVANINAPGQIVISGEKAKVEIAVGLAKERGIRRATLLNVAGAYHSQLMESAYQKLGVALLHVPVQPPRFPVISNVTGAEATTPIEIRRTLQDQVTGTVRWVDCMERLVDLGCDLFIEIGPGGVLAGLLKRTCKDADVVSVNDAESVRKCAGRIGG